MSTEQPFFHARQPIQIADCTIKNRIVRTAHGTNAQGLDGLPTEEWIALHEARARGGVGLAIMEGGSPVHKSSAPPIWPWRWLRLDDDEIVEHLQPYVERLHAHGQKVFQQLWHGGVSSASQDGGPSWSASAVADPLTGRMPLAMTQLMIDEIVDAYASAARRCEDAGYDGVEVSSGHSYLVHQFLSPAYNRRTDDYGGSLENRMRFLAEVLAACRAAVSPGFPVGIRVSASDGIAGGLEPGDTAIVASRLEEQALVDYVNVSISSYHSSQLFIGGMAFPRGYQLPTSAPVTAALSVPTIVTGRILTMEHAEEILAAGTADLVSMVRANLADPEIVNKSFAGEASRVRPCIGCNQGCVGALFFGMTVGCAVNPEAGQETVFPPVSPATESKRVVVVGGGLAGMEAARTAAESGHEVILYEADDALGGQLRWARRAARREDLGRIVDWLPQELSVLGVDVRLGRPVTAAEVQSDEPDLVIVATGSVLRRDGVQRKAPFVEVEGMELPHVVTSLDVLTKIAPDGEEVLVFDDLGGPEAISVAETLLESGARVVFATSANSMAPGLEPTLNHDGYAHRLLPNDRFQVLTQQSLVRVTETAARLVGLFSKQATEIPADLVVAVTGAAPRRDLYDELVGLGANVAIVGDALEAADLQHAVRTARLAGIVVENSLVATA